VEDEVLVQDILREALEEGGYQVIVVDDGPSAIDFLKRRDAELAGMVTDINLGPGPKGWDVARLAREIHHDVPVIYVSGDSAHEWAAQGVPQSVMIQKPFANSQIIVALAGLANAKMGDL
jgi:CheY-like chemotaxis protein